MNERNKWIIFGTSSKVQERDLTLKVRVFESDQGRDELEGMVEIPLKRLEDQYKHDEWFDLTDGRGTKVHGKIHLVLQWIHSLVAYYQEVVEKWNEHIVIHEEDLIEYERDIEVLCQPFPLLKQKNTVTLFSRERGGGDLPVHSVINSVNMRGASGQKKEEPITSSTHYSYLTSRVWLGLAMLASYYRPMFIDVSKSNKPL